VVVCTHRDQIRAVQPSAKVCEACVKLGDDWVELRMCRTCGNVACCDDSKNRHATAHFQATGHPLMRTLEPGQRWTWCYVDKVMVD
jgi:CPA2 family monovalent cation:H+ antiporter-2